MPFYKNVNPIFQNFHVAPEYFLYRCWINNFMLIEKVIISAYQLPLKTAWKDRHQTMHFRKGWIITLSSEGLNGKGDCAPLPSAGTETWQQAKDWFSQNLQQLSGKSIDEIRLLLPAIPSAVACALDTALIDLLSKAKNISISQWLNPDCEAEVRTNINWGALNNINPETLSEMPVAPVIKLKLGLADIQHEVKQLQLLCNHLPSGCRLRLDANQAWSFQDAMNFIDQCNDLPVESIEEPLTRADLKLLNKLQQSSKVPIALDESLSQFNVDQLLEGKVVNRLTLKPMVVGGLEKTLKLANRANQLGIESVITTTVDSAIGVWAAVHVAAALGSAGRKLSHGLATSQWLQQDIAQPPLISDNIIKLH